MTAMITDVDYVTPTQVASEKPSLLVNVGRILTLRLYIMEDLG